MLFDMLTPLKRIKPVTRSWPGATASLTHLRKGTLRKRTDVISVGFVLHDLPNAVVGYGGDTPRRVPLTAGTGSLLAPDTECDLAWEDDRTDIRLQIDVSVFHKVNGGREVSFAPHYGYVDPTAFQLVANLVAADSYDDVTRLYRETVTLALAAHIMRHLPATQSDVAPPQFVIDPRIARAIEVIEADFDKDVSLDRLANAAGMSPFAFSRAFKKATGEPPHKFLMRRRIERAKMLLRSTRMAVAEIAYRVGWENVSHFIEVFRRVAGVTPGQFRQAVA